MAIVTASTGVRLSGGTCRAITAGDMQSIVDRFAEIETALCAIVRDVNDYEEANNLSPNPGRTECWDSVARAKALLK